MKQHASSATPQALCGIHLSLGSKLEGIAYAKSLGCNTVQIFTHNPRSFQFSPIDTKKMETLRLSWKDIGVHPVFSHCNYLINLGTSDEAMWHASLATAKKELDYAREFGCDYFVLHVGKYKDSSVEKGISQVVKALNKLEPDLKRTNVMLLLETVAGQGTEIGRTFEELNLIFEQVEPSIVEHLGVCLDTCHIFAAGYDIRTAVGVDKTIANIESTFGVGKIKLIHVNDSKGELGDNLDRHEHLGLGKIGIDGLKKFLTHHKIAPIPKVIETPIDENLGQEDDLKVLQGFYK
jgi:deoxyribonuclease-4